MCGRIHPHPGVTPSALSVTSRSMLCCMGKKTLLSVLPSLGTKRCLKLVWVGQNFNSPLPGLISAAKPVWVITQMPGALITSPLKSAAHCHTARRGLGWDQCLLQKAVQPARGTSTRSASWVAGHARPVQHRYTVTDKIFFFFFSFMLLHNIARH